MGHFSKRRHDSFHHGLRFLKNLIIPKAQNPKACSLQLSGSSHIFGDSLRMLSTIKFNDQFCFERNEIKDVAIKRMLPAKLRAQLLAAQESP